VVLSGLEPTGNVVGAPARFTVETSAAGPGELEVVVVNPKGTPEKVCLLLLLLLLLFLSVIFISDSMSVSSQSQEMTPLAVKLQSTVSH